MFTRLNRKSLLSLSLLGTAWAATESTPSRVIGDPDAMLGPKSAARGAATTGSHLIHDSIFQNPAAAATEQSYTVTVGYSPMGEQLAASIVDTKSSTIGGAVSYVRRDLRDSSAAPLSLGNFKRTEDRVALSFFGMASEDLAIGASGKYTYQKSFDGLSETGKNYNGDLGVKYIVSRRLQVGIVGQNLLTDDSGMNTRAFAVGVETLPLRSLNFSARVIHYPKPGSSAQFQVPNSSKLTGWALGTEWAFYKGFALRGGYKDQPTWNEKTASAGLGYSDKEWGADYSFQMSTQGDKSTAHSATLYGRF